MQQTAESIYKYFLSIIRKERSTVVTPDEFNLLYSSTTIDWIKGKLPTNEFNQKRIDDLQAIHVFTERIKYASIKGKFVLPDDYLYGLSASFSKCDFGAENNPVVLSTISGKILRSDIRNVIRDNPYRVPDENVAYFDIQDNFVYLTSDNNEDYRCMNLEYYKYPEFLVYSTGDDSTTGSFSYSQNQEIAELAARKYLERVGDRRYQTYAGEQMSTPN